MPTNTTNKSSETSQKNNLMQLTTAQKEKFLEYLERKGLPVPKGSQTSQGDSEPYENELSIDLVSLCVADIVKNLEQTDEYRMLDDDKKKSFSYNLRVEFIEDFVDKFELLIEQNPDIRKELADIGKSIEKIDELLEIFNEVILEIPAIRDSFFKTIKEKYSQLCGDLGLINNYQIIFSY